MFAITNRRPHQKCLGSARLPEGWCWPIYYQHELNRPQVCVNVARCRLHPTFCMIAPN